MEARHLLSATADVVILMDSSQSSDSSSVSRLDFTAELIRVVDQRLVSRGIGGEPTQDHDGSVDDADYSSAPENRYRVIEWGSNNPSSDEAVVPNHSVHAWKNAVDAAVTIEDISLSGGVEDAWEAIHFASGGSPQSEDKGSITDLSFRDNAAVHFIVVTDSPVFDGDPETLGPSLRHRRNYGEYFSATFDDMLASLEMSTLGGNHVSDAVVTFLAGANYYENAFPSLWNTADVLLGVDVDFQDGWDVDRRAEAQRSPNQATIFVADYVDGSGMASVTASSNDASDEITIISSHEFYLGDSIMFKTANIPGGLSPSEVYYVINRTDVKSAGVDVGDRFQLSLEIGGAPVAITTDEVAATVILPAKVSQVTDDFTPDSDFQVIEAFLDGEDFINDQSGVPSYPPIPEVIYQGDESDGDPVYEGELYAYLTWASGGTFWDIEPLTVSWFDIDSPEVNLLMQAMAMDIFDKIAIQVTDFDNDRFAVDLWGFHGMVGDIGDVDLLMNAMQNGGNLDLFDLDDDHDIDLYDLARLIVLVYYTRMGDADLNGIVDQMDLNALGKHWSMTTNDGWADGDFNGDGVVNYIDLNFIGINWQKEHP